MTVRRLIYASFLIPIVMMGAGFLIFRFYLPLPQGQSFSGRFEMEAMSIYGEDGTLLTGTVFRPASPPASVVVIAADQGLDRNWNPSGASFRSGAIVARALASAGSAVLIFDQRGTGSSVLSGRNFADLENLSDDLLSMAQRAAAEHPNVPIELLGHGQGCVLSLLAVNRSRLVIRKVRLFSCAYSGTILESWGERLLARMQQDGVREDTLRIARGEWRTSLAGGAGSFASGPHTKEMRARVKEREMQGFLKTVRYLDEAERVGWTRTARKITFKTELRSALRHTRIQHYFPQYNEESAETELAEFSAWARTTSKMEPNYTVLELPGADHLLKEQNRPAQGPLDLLIRRSNPLRPLAPSLIDVLARR